MALISAEGREGRLWGIDLDAFDDDEEDSQSPVAQGSRCSTFSRDDDIVFHDVRSTLSPDSSSEHAGSIFSHVTDWHDAKEIILPDELLSSRKLQVVAPASLGLPGVPDYKPYFPSSLADHERGWQLMLTEESATRAARACYMNDQYAEICRNYSCETEEKKQWDQDRKAAINRHITSLLEKVSAQKKSEKEKRQEALRKEKERDDLKSRKEEALRKQDQERLQMQETKGMPDKASARPGVESGNSKPFPSDQQKHTRTDSNSSMVTRPLTQSGVERSFPDMSHLSSQEGVKTIGGGDIMNPRLRSMQLQSIRAEALMLRGAEAKKQQEMERIKLEEAKKKAAEQAERRAAELAKERKAAQDELVKKALEPPDRGPLAFQGPSSLITGMVDAPKQLLKKEQQFSSEKTLAQVHQPASIAPQSTPGPSDTLPAGISFYGAQSAKQFETERRARAEQILAKMGLFETQDMHKKERRMISKNIKIEITQVSGNMQQVSQKAKILTQLLDRLTEERLYYAYQQFAQTVISKCDGLIQNLVFPLCEVIMRVTAVHRPLLDAILWKLHKVSILTIPKYYTIENPQRRTQWKNLLLYKRVEEGTSSRLETDDEFMARQSGYVMMYAGMTQVNNGNNPHGASEAWKYLARMLNELPATRWTAVALENFLRISGHMLFQRYQNQMVKVLKVIDKKFLASLAANGDKEVRSSYTRLHTYLNLEKFRDAPEGSRMPDRDESSLVAV